jgi:hypothetical protein
MPPLGFLPSCEVDVQFRLSGGIRYDGHGAVYHVTGRP